MYSQKGPGGALEPRAREAEAEIVEDGVPVPPLPGDDAFLPIPAPLVRLKGKELMLRSLMLQPPPMRGQPDEFWTNTEATDVAFASKKWTPTNFQALTGKDLAPRWAAKSHNSVPAKRAAKTLRDWYEAPDSADWRQVVETRHSYLMFRYHERLELSNFSYLLPEHIIDLEVKVKSGTIEGIAAEGELLMMTVNSETTVSVLIAKVFDETAKKGATNDDKGRSDGRYIFNVVGRCEYLMHGLWRLVDYAAVSEAQRRGERLKLELSLLNEELFDALAPQRATTKRDERRLMQKSKMLKGDGVAFRRGITIDEDGVLHENDHLHKPSFSLSEKSGAYWRVVVKKYVGCPFVCDGVCVELRMYDGGGTAEHIYGNQAVGTSPVPFANMMKWNPGFVLQHPSALDVTQMPLSTRFTLTIIGAQEGESFIVAHVALPLVTDEGLLKTGTAQIRLWPTTTSGKEMRQGTGPNRVSKIPGMCVDARDLQRHLLGENPLDDGGVLTVKFELQGLDDDDTEVVADEETVGLVPELIMSDEQEDDEDEELDEEEMMHLLTTMDAEVKSRSPGELKAAMLKAAENNPRRASYDAAAMAEAKQLEPVTKKMGSTTKLSFGGGNDLDTSNHSTRSATSTPKETGGGFIGKTLMSGFGGLVGPTMESRSSVAGSLASSEGVDEDAQILGRIALRPPLDAQLTSVEREVLWRNRNDLTTTLSLLPPFWLSVPRHDPEALKEARSLVAKWDLGGSTGDLFSGRIRVALEMLWWQHSDRFIRGYACAILDTLRDDDFSEALLQLVQALKMEINHDSALARLMIRRAACNPLQIGHRLYWLLRAEMSRPVVCERFGVVLGTLMEISGLAFRKLMADECHLNELLCDAARAVKAFPTKPERLEEAQRIFARINKEMKQRHADHGTGFPTPLHPTLRCSEIIIEKSFVLSSKKVPLYVCLQCIDEGAEDFRIIYKDGDDLRQDQLTLQLIKLMDVLWQRHGLKLELWPYVCVATGKSSGFIEVVKNSKTTADIQVQHGYGAMGAFNDRVIAEFIKVNNANFHDYERARATFIASCAGYCVATFVLGIGDRHADNIMVTKQGRLFHIDFGHFLGNFKSKFGVQRERSPFVFTPDMKHMMQYISDDHAAQRRLLMSESQRGPSMERSMRGGSTESLGFADFEMLSCRAYNLLRQKASTLITLFALMIPAKMPQLTSASDINYVSDRLALHYTSSQAAETFRGEIKNAVATTSRRLDNYFHNLRHA